jgi:hypothetical protein
MKPNIELHIEELILTGVDRSDSLRVAEAVQTQLQRLLQDQGLPPSLAKNAEIGEIRAGPLQEKGRHTAGQKELVRGPEVLGNSVAQAIYSGFHKTSP